MVDKLNIKDQVLEIEKRKFSLLLQEEFTDVEILSIAGSFSTVLKGENIKLGRFEAIKAINYFDAMKKGLKLEKIEEEFRIMAKLDHPHIIKVHNVMNKMTPNNEAYLFIVMEYCESTLEHQIQSNKRGMERKRAIRLFRQIVNGVSYIHSQGIIHRDLKPANIFLKNGIIKIGNFNISKIKEEGTRGTTSQVF